MSKKNPTKADGKKNKPEKLLISTDTKIGDVTTFYQELYFKELSQNIITSENKKQRKVELTEKFKQMEQVFAELNLKCFKCDAATTETFAEGAELHPFDANEVVKTLNEKLMLDMSLLKVKQIEDKK
ncbi:MAG: hypothetical protein K8S87_02620 [Planctomycetes bacterium]|nr:hypothetical protein [Planctomycetota bacterium]